MSKITFNDIEFFNLPFTKEYLISKCGLILSLPKNRGNNNITSNNYIILQHETLKGGYKKVSIYFDSKQKSFLIHKLLALTFLENKNNYKFVVFKDGNTTNISLDNLDFSNNCKKYAIKISKSYGVGVTFDKRNKYRPYCAKIKINGNVKILGYFSTALEAQNEYKKAKEKLQDRLF